MLCTPSSNWVLFFLKICRSFYIYIYNSNQSFKAAFCWISVLERITMFDFLSHREGDRWLDSLVSLLSDVWTRGEDEDQVLRLLLHADRSLQVRPGAVSRWVYNRLTCALVILQSELFLTLQQLPSVQVTWTLWWSLSPSRWRMAQSHSEQVIYLIYPTRLKMYGNTPLTGCLLHRTYIFLDVRIPWLHTWLCDFSCCQQTTMNMFTRCWCHLSNRCGQLWEVAQL